MPIFDPDDYLKPYFDPDRNEVGFRIGIPIISWEIRKQPKQKPKWTDYNEVEVHNFHLKSVASDGLQIGLSLRWKQFESNLIGERYKRAETNCDANALAQFYVSSKHQIISDKPLISGIDCTTSGFGLEQIFDYMVQGMTLIISGGENKVGLFDVLAAFGTLGYNFVAYFSDAQITISDPVQHDMFNNRPVAK